MNYLVHFICLVPTSNSHHPVDLGIKYNKGRSTCNFVSVLTYVFGLHANCQIVISFINEHIFRYVDLVFKFYVLVLY